MPFDTPDIEKNYSTTQRITLTVAACAGMTLLATPLLGYLDLANIVMLFLLTVLIVAVKLGRNAAILASVISARLASRAALLSIWNRLNKPSVWRLIPLSAWRVFRLKASS